jgi:class 3 adenylate cyclase/ketosteroid isomerase-like protein
MASDPELEAECLAFMREFQQALDRKDIEAVLAMASPEIVGFGTGAHERNRTIAEFRAQMEQDAAQSSDVERENRWITATRHGEFAMFATEYDVRWIVDGYQNSELARFTAVLERHDGRWRLLQSHMSFPATGQAEGQAWPSSIQALASAVSEERPDLRGQAAPDGTVTMLFTDIENSTVLTERLGDMQWLDVLREHNGVVRGQVAEHGCFEVKSQGDGFMIASQSARRAIHCAIGIQRNLDSINAQSAEPVKVRMGLHTGEVLKDADDFFGKHVILASRIAGKAHGGEILVSSILKELTESGGDISFGTAREFEL